MVISNFNFVLYLLGRYGTRKLLTTFFFMAKLLLSCFTDALVTKVV